MGEITHNNEGCMQYEGESFRIVLHRYTDPDRLNLADSAALYLGKSDTENTRRPLSVMNMGHALEIFRGESATFKFYGVSKEVYDHLTTYKTMQMRVAGGNRALRSDGFTVPSDKVKNPELVAQKIEGSLRNYHELLEAGETPQVARSAMPVNVQLNPFKLQFNFQTLIESLFVQRIFEHGAQGNTVQVVRGMFDLVHAMDPDLWNTVIENYGPHVKEWKDVQKKLRRRPMTVAQLYQQAYEKGLDEEPVEEYLREAFGAQKSMW